MSYLALDGVELYYELHGEGHPLVFIHGASGTHLTWWQQVAEFRHHFSCLIFDQRGFGKSRATADYDVGDGNILYRDLRALVEHVGFGSERINIIGASLGTGPALHFAMENPDQIEKLVLVCGTGGVTTPLIAAGWDQRYSRMRGRQKQINTEEPRTSSVGHTRVPRVRSAGELERFSVAYHPYGPVGEAMHFDSPALTFLYAEIMASAGGPATVDLLPCFDARRVTAEEAAGIQYPVLITGGTEDPLFPAAELEEVARLFPSGQLNLFKGAGHAAYYEKARRFNDLVLDFLRSEAQ